MYIQRFAPPLALLAMMWLGGCTSSKQVNVWQPQAGWEAPSSDLVMPSAELDEFALAPDSSADSSVQAWMLARNDVLLGSWPDPYAGGFEFFEIRQREYLRTINGQPNDYSTTFVWSIKRGVTR